MSETRDDTWKAGDVDAATTRRQALEEAAKIASTFMSRNEYEATKRDGSPKRRFDLWEVRQVLKFTSESIGQEISSLIDQPTLDATLQEAFDMSKGEC